MAHKTTQHPLSGYNHPGAKGSSSTRETGLGKGIRRSRFGLKAGVVLTVAGLIWAGYNAETHKRAHNDAVANAPMPLPPTPKPGANKGEQVVSTGTADERLQAYVGLLAAGHSARLSYVGLPVEPLTGDGPDGAISHENQLAEAARKTLAPIAVRAACLAWPQAANTNPALSARITVELQGMDTNQSVSDHGTKIAPAGLATRAIEDCQKIINDASRNQELLFPTE